MIKALTFEEWMTRNACGRTTTSSQLFNSARIGMVPEDECVRLPKPEEWPKEASYIGLAWENERQYIIEPIFRHIPRPVPAWTPKVDEYVFIHLNDPYLPGVVRSIPSKGSPYYEIQVNGRLEKAFTNGILKPFAPEHIGKPWEDIHNA